MDSFKDIENIGASFEDLRKEIQYLENRFLAIGLDYQYHFGMPLGQNEFYELRDNVSYRLFCANLHLELLLRQHFIIEARFGEIYKSQPEKITANIYPSNPIFDHAEKEISGIFDSLIYHLVSIFDYLGTLTNYIFGKKKQDTLTWTSLATSVRDKNNAFSKTKFADVINTIDNNFVKKLYDHRSHLIHRKGEINRSHIKFTLNDGKFNVSYISTNALNKQFSVLKEESKTHSLTIKYVGFWLVRKTIFEVSSILFALKDEMDATKQGQNPSKIRMGIINPGTHTLSSPSEEFWCKQQFEKLKSSF